MDAELSTLINQKKTGFLKVLSIKGTELNTSKSIKINGDLTCSKVTCDSIEINPTGNKTQIKDAEITNSSLDSTPIGLSEPSTAYVTQLNVLSTVNGNETQGINIDGDINIFNSDEGERRIVSTNPLRILTTRDLNLRSSKNVIIKARRKLYFNNIR